MKDLDNTREAPDVIEGVYLSGDGFDLAAFYGPSFKAFSSELRLRVPHEITDPAAVRFAMSWVPTADAFAAYPNLALLCVPGAGVDGLLEHPNLPPRAAITRLRDPDQGAQMAGFAVHEVLHVERGFAQLARDRANRHWAPMAARPPSEVVVAVLGNGTMGRAVAQAFVALGFRVRVASRSAPQQPLAGAEHHSGAQALRTAATGADYVINVLPLTPATRGALDAALFARMRPGGWLVQIGRGEHLVEDDLLAALDAGHLRGASLDVFGVEPLPRAHPFWADQRLRLSPHVASIASPELAARQIAQSVRELREGRPLSFAVDLSKGY